MTGMSGCFHNTGRYLSRQCLVFHLQTTLRSCGPAALTYVYISDSFHIRATTSAASIGSEDSIIHMLGQWHPPLCENPKGTTCVHLRTANWSGFSTFRLQTTHFLSLSQCYRKDTCKITWKSVFVHLNTRKYLYSYRCTCIYPTTVHTIKHSLPHWKVDDCWWLLISIL